MGVFSGKIIPVKRLNVKSEEGLLVSENSKFKTNWVEGKEAERNLVEKKIKHADFSLTFLNANAKFSCI